MLHSADIQFLEHGPSRVDGKHKTGGGVVVAREP